MECNKKFNLLKRRKHHCRVCGRVVCARCSENRVKLQNSRSDKPVRVCTKCFGRMAPSYLQKKESSASIASVASTSSGGARPGATARTTSEHTRGGGGDEAPTRPRNSASADGRVSQTDKDGLKEPLMGSGPQAHVQPGSGYDSDEEQEKSGLCHCKCGIM